jgi:hypothetical protein
MCDVISTDQSLDQARAWESENFNAEISRVVVCARCKKTDKCVDEASDLKDFDRLINNGCCIIRPCETTDQTTNEKFVQYFDAAGTAVYLTTDRLLSDIAERVVFGDDSAPITVCGATEIAPVAKTTQWRTEVTNLEA